MKGVKALLAVIVISVISSFSLSAAVLIKASSGVKVVSAGDEAAININLTDDSNYAVSNTPVTLSLVSGGGTINPLSVTTSIVGVAKAAFTAGDLPGTTVIKIEAKNAVPVLLSIEVKESPAAEFSVSLDKEKIYVDTRSNLNILVKNFKGKGCPNVTINLKASEFIEITPATGKTDTNGKFSAVLKAGKVPGTAKYEVTAGTLAAQVKEIKVLPSAVDTFTAIAEPYALYTRSSSTIKVKVLDTGKKPIAGTGLVFQVIRGDAELEKKEAATDSNGACAVKVKTGLNEGTVTVKVKLAEKERAAEAEPITVNISVAKLIQPPFKLELTAEHPFALSGDDVAFNARVLDKDGYPSIGAAVAFEVTKGDGKLQQVLLSTDQEGRALVILTTGKKSGDNTVKAKCEQLAPAEATVKTEAKVTYSRKKAGEPVKLSAFLVKNGGKISVKAVITDMNYIPVPEVQVYFKVISGKGKLSTELANTDANGTAAAVFTPEDYGAINLQVSAASLLETKGLVYKKTFPVKILLAPVLALCLFALFIYFFLRGQSVRQRYFDPATGLHNELFAKYRLKKAMKNRRKFTVLFLDFNNFRSFNTFNGEEKGTLLIKAVADILKNNIGKGEIACHLGGDDFAAIVNPEKTESLPQKLLLEISEKIRSFYPEKDSRAGFILTKDENGKEVSRPLATVSIAVLKSTALTSSNFNELLDKAGNVMNSAKSRGGNAIAYEVDDNADKKRKYKMGWFTLFGLLLVLLFPSRSAAEESKDNGMILSAWAGEMSGIERVIKINAHVTDAKERPVSNVFVLFSVESGDGMLEECFAVTDDSGNCILKFYGGHAKGANIVRVYGEGLLPVDVDVKLRTSGIEILLYFSLIMSLALTGILFAKILNMRLLLKGIDKDGGFRTRLLAEQQLKKLTDGEKKFVTTFVQYRDFTEFCKAYGYDKGDKAVKTLSDYIKEAVLAAGGREKEIFYFWQDHFVIVSSAMRHEEFANDLISTLGVSIPIICEDLIQNFHFMHLLIAQVESDNLKERKPGEIMGLGELLINKANIRMESSSLTYSKYLKDEKAKIETV